MGIDPAVLARAVREYLGREPVDAAERRQVEASVIMKVAFRTPMLSVGMAGPGSRARSVPLEAFTGAQADGDTQPEGPALKALRQRRAARQRGDTGDEVDREIGPAEAALKRRRGAFTKRARGVCKVCGNRLERRPASDPRHRVAPFVCPSCGCGSDT